MTRTVRWSIAIGSAAVAVGLGAAFWIGTHPGSEPPVEGVSSDVLQGPDAQAPARPRPRPFRVPRPDQPGWTQRPSAEDYGLDKHDFLVAYHRSRHLGQPEPVEGDPGIVRVEPFRVAALPLEDSPPGSNEVEEFVQAEEIARRLREARVPAFGNPVLVYQLENPGDPSTWEEQADIHVGIPVAQDVEVPKGFKVVEVPGGEALASDPAPRVSAGEEPDWPALVGRARAKGREPAFPLVVRYSGWRRRPPAPTFQALLFLKPTSGVSGDASPPGEGNASPPDP